MATTLVVRFVLGRYHATPWGRHVNEGQVELPPSPWRLLRALYAVWQTRVPDLEEDVVHSLLGRLAEAPCYFVPPYQLGHTRHYYPDTKHRSGAPSTDRTLDAFAVLPSGAELGVRWPFDLPAEERKVFGRLADSLPYLGRADSLCEARVTDDWQPDAGHRLSSPLDIGESVPADVAVVTLLAPTLPLDLDALVARPVEVRGQKLLFPPHTRFVGYQRPPELAVRRRPRRPSWQPVQAARFTITSRVLPPQTDVVVLTDRLRGGALRRLGDVRGDARAYSVLAGRDVDEKKLRGHRHAHYLALADDQRRLAEVAVWIPAGLDEHEMQALSRVTRLWAPEGVPGPGVLEIRLAAYGTTCTVLDDLVGPAAHWESLTPFVPPRHAKRDWGDFIGREVRRELRHRALPEPVEVSIQDDDWRSYARFRPSKRFKRAYANSDLGMATPGPADPRSGPPGAFVHMTFRQQVAGPLMLGYLSHFGLGLFRPA